jgi:ribosomal peptide maturation radical SAM protein 1
MPSAPKHPAAKIALISTPWPLYSRPSIQLGTLKAYLQSHHPDIQVDAHHVYLKVARSVGYPLYHEISERTWLAEAIYGALLFPERRSKIEKLFSREADPRSPVGRTGLDQITSRVKKATEDFINSINWNEYLLAGLSVSLCQLTSSLYFIRRLKHKYPALIIVIGGSTFSGTITQAFFERFADVDAVINGEGELPFSRLVSRLVQTPQLCDLPPNKGVVLARSAGNRPTATGFHQLKSLNNLLPPDYDDYFEMLKSFGPRNVFFPTLPVEISRGCWWQKSISARDKTAGCAFCNLNLQWTGYRAKNPRQAAAEIDHLTARHRCLSVALVDNVLPLKTTRAFFENLIELKKDLRLFAEIRATISFSELKRMHRAGVQELQIGIEALSTSLLKKLHKGTTAITNLEIMKNCEALGIINLSNLILHFPGSDEHDVKQTLDNLEFALPFRPLRTVVFWLGMGSPVWQNPANYGIVSFYNHPNWRYLFGRATVQSVRFMIQAYRGDRGYQQKIWRPVKEKVRRWHRDYEQLSRNARYHPLLSFRDGREFLIIRQQRSGADPLTHRLVGTSREIYLFCQQHHTLKRIRQRFCSFSEDKIVAFLKMMVDKKLMFKENDRYLSLAVPLKPIG